MISSKLSNSLAILNEVITLSKLDLKLKGNTFNDLINLNNNKQPLIMV
jgi:hypothetical protein